MIETKVIFANRQKNDLGEQQKAGRSHKQRTFRLLIWGVIPF